MLYNHSHTSNIIANLTTHCDVCGQKITEGDTLFVGSIDSGMLVSVASCCRIILHSVFSQSEYWSQPEESSLT